jgi:hypothetical protein
MIIKSFLLFTTLLFTTIAIAQTTSSKPKFGEGLKFEGENYKLKIGYRFQNQFSNEWSVRNDDLNYVEGLQTKFLIRRSRLKFSGWAVTPKLKYKAELGLSNRDLSGGNGPEYSYASRLMLDAFLEWNFYKNFSIWAGQGKMPGNRQRLVSSGNMQFVDRSLLNSKFTLDRDMGIMLKHHFKIGDHFIVKELYSLSQGEGRNLTVGNFNGFAHTFKVEFLPLGNFAQKKGEYIESDLYREPKPKLAIAFAHDINQNTVRERGQLGDFIINSNGDYVGKTLNTSFIDMIFKYKGYSFMSEFAYRTVQGNDPNVYDTDDSTVIGTYYTGMAFNVETGYVLKSNWEIAGRYTMVSPQASSGYNNENQYAIAFSKYIVGHKLKVQTDLTYRQIANKDDKLVWRVQFDIHF